MHSSSEGLFNDLSLVSCRKAGRVSPIFCKSHLVYCHPECGCALNYSSNGECEKLFRCLINNAWITGQQTSGRVIAQQCTGMQSVHARIVFPVKEGHTMRMVPISKPSSIYLSSSIHLMLQRCTYAYPFVHSATFCILILDLIRPLHNTQCRVDYKPNDRQEVSAAYLNCHPLLYVPVVLLHVTNNFLPMAFYWINSRGDWNGYEINIPVFCLWSRRALIFQPTLHQYSPTRRSHKWNAFLSPCTDCSWVP